MRHDYLEGFFPLEDDALTLAVARANLELFRASDASGAAVEDDERDEGGGADEDGVGIRFLELGRQLPTERVRRGSAPHNPHLEACRRTIRERIYRYLAVLSRSPHARSEQPYELLNVMPRALVNLLGIGNSRERSDEELPVRLTFRFRDWLAEQDGRRFVVEWGEMWLPEPELLMLRAREVEHREPRRVQTLTGFPAPRTRSFRNR